MRHSGIPDSTVLTSTLPQLQMTLCLRCWGLPKPRSHCFWPSLVSLLCALLTRNKAVLRVPQTVFLVLHILTAYVTRPVCASQNCVCIQCPWGLLDAEGTGGWGWPGPSSQVAWHMDSLWSLDHTWTIDVLKEQSKMCKTAFYQFLELLILIFKKSQPKF